MPCTAAWASCSCARNVDITAALSPRRGSFRTTSGCEYVWPSTMSFNMYVPGKASGPCGAGVTEPGDEFIWLLMSGVKPGGSSYLRSQLLQFVPVVVESARSDEGINQ